MFQIDKLLLSGVIAISIKIVAVLLQLLIIFKTIPYSWVYGGMMPSYSIGLSASLGYIFIMLIFMLVYAVACELIPYHPKQWLRYSLLGFLILSIGMDIYNFIMQLRGTSFERYVLSMVGALMLITDVWVVFNFDKPLKFANILGHFSKTKLIAND